MEDRCYPVLTVKDGLNDTKIVTKGRIRVFQYTATHGKISFLRVIGTVDSHSILSSEGASSEEVFSLTKTGNRRGRWEVSGFLKVRNAHALAHRITLTTQYVQVYGRQTLTLHPEDSMTPRNSKTFSFHEKV